MSAKRKKNYKPKGTSPKGVSNKQANQVKKVKLEEATSLPSWLVSLELFIEKRALLLTMLLLTSIGIIVFWDFLTLRYVYFFRDIGSDIVNGTLPMLEMRAKMIQEEGSPLFWTFYKGMGENFFTGHPMEPIGFAFKQIDDFLLAVFGVEYSTVGRVYRVLFMDFLIIGLLAYGYFRTIRLSGLVAIVGSLAFVYSGYMVMGSTWGHMGTILRGIYLLFAFEQFYVKKRWIFLPFAGVILTSNPFYFFVYSLFVLTYSLVRFISDRIQTKQALYIYLQAALLVLLGFVMNLVNNISAYIKLFRSPRVAGNVSTMSSAGKAEVFQIDNFPEWITVIYRSFATDFLGNGSSYKGWYNYLEAPLFYIGIFALLLLPQFFVYLSKRNRIIWGTFVGFWLLTAFVPYLRYAIQAFVGNYYKGPYDVILGLVILLPALWALHNLIKKQKLNIPLLIGTVLVYLFLLNFSFTSEISKVVDLRVKIRVIFFIIIYGVLLYGMTRKELAKYAQLAFLAAILIELTSFSSYTINQRKAYRGKQFELSAGGYKDNTIAALNYIKQQDSTLFYRAEKDFSSGSAEHSSLNDATAQGYFGTASYSSFNQEYYIKFLLGTGTIPDNNETVTRWSPGVRQRPLLQSLVGVKYYFTKNEKSNMLRFGYEKLTKTGDVIVLRNKYALPLGVAYDRVIVRSEFDKLSNLQKDLMLLRAAVVEEPDNYSQFTHLTSKDTITNFGFEPYGQFVDSRRNTSLNLTSFRSDELLGDIALKQEHLLYYSIPFDFGWKAYIDDKEVDTHLTNIGFLGIKVPEGKHKVLLKYRPVLYYESLWVSAISTLSLILIFILLEFKKRRQSKSTTDS